MYAVPVRTVSLPCLSAPAVMEVSLKDSNVQLIFPTSLMLGDEPEIAKTDAEQLTAITTSRSASELLKCGPSDSARSVKLPAQAHSLFGVMNHTSQAAEETPCTAAETGRALLAAMNTAAPFQLLGTLPQRLEELCAFQDRYASTEAC